MKNILLSTIVISLCSQMVFCMESKKQFPYQGNVAGQINRISIDSAKAISKELDNNIRWFIAFKMAQARSNLPEVGANLSSIDRELFNLYLYSQNNSAFRNLAKSEDKLNCQKFCRIYGQICDLLSKEPDRLIKIGSNDNACNIFAFGQAVNNFTNVNYEIFSDQFWNELSIINTRMFQSLVSISKLLSTKLGLFEDFSKEKEESILMDINREREQKIEHIKIIKLTSDNNSKGFSVSMPLMKEETLKKRVSNLSKNSKIFNQVCRALDKNTSFNEKEESGYDFIINNISITSSQRDESFHFTALNNKNGNITSHLPNDILGIKHEFGHAVTYLHYVILEILAYANHLDIENDTMQFAANVFSTDSNITIEDNFIKLLGSVSEK